MNSFTTDSLFLNNGRAMDEQILDSRFWMLDNNEFTLFLSSIQHQHGFSRAID